MGHVLIIYATVFISAVSGRTGIGSGEEDWGHVEVREGAHMFYWLFYTTADVDYRTRPLVIWLQGGPGASSTGFGNFWEIGVLDRHLNKRKHSWVKNVNVLFIDNPVNCGFSYVEDLSLLVTNNREIAEDLVTFTRNFLKTHPEFHTIQLYIFGESYGGKMAVEFAYLLEKEIKRGNINALLKGVALGNSWISPIDSVLSWAPFLLETGMVDRNGYKDVKKAARETEEIVNDGNFTAAEELWGHTENVIFDVTNGISFYNILEKIPYGHLWAKQSVFSRIKYEAKPSHADDDEDYEVNYREYLRFEKWMNNHLREVLGISENVTWHDIGPEVFRALKHDFMKPVTDIVELLLNETEVEVAVYSGNLDLIVGTSGTMVWVERLKWPGASSWKNSKRKVLAVNGIVDGYVKKHGRFSFYWVLRAGHMVPTDNPKAALAVLRHITHGKS